MTGAGHLLVGSIGTSDYDIVTYELDGETRETELSPVALVALLNSHPTIDIVSKRCGTGSITTIYTAAAEGRCLYLIRSITGLPLGFDTDKRPTSGYSSSIYSSAVSTSVANTATSTASSSVAAV